MIDFDEEFKLLKRWLDYKIDYDINKALNGRVFMIDKFKIPVMSIEQHMDLFHRMGYMIVSSEDELPVSEVICLPFEEWRKFNIS